jgi:peptidoglycan-N-acetylglucosamine deacetylase
VPRRRHRRPRKWQRRVLVSAGITLGPLLAALAFIAARPVPSADASLADKLAHYRDRVATVLDRGLIATLDERRAEELGGVQDHIFVRGAGDSPRVALTFDDGPHPRTTPQLLEILGRYDARATFFVVGKMAKLHPELLVQELEAGNEVGNHSYHHMNLEQVPLERLKNEITWAGEIIQRATGHPPTLFRPPGGDYDRRVLQAAADLGYTVVLWTDNPGDYVQQGAEEVRKRVMASVKPGAVVVLHDGRDQTAEALPLILEDLRGMGYQCVTVSELMGDDHAR